MIARIARVKHLTHNCLKFTHIPAAFQTLHAQIFKMTLRIALSIVLIKAVWIFAVDGTRSFHVAHINLFNRIFSYKSPPCNPYCICEYLVLLHWMCIDCVFNLVRHGTTFNTWWLAFGCWRVPFSILVSPNPPAFGIAGQGETRPATAFSPQSRNELRNAVDNCIQDKEAGSIDDGLSIPLVESHDKPSVFSYTFRLLSFTQSMSTYHQYDIGANLIDPMFQGPCNLVRIYNL